MNEDIEEAMLDAREELKRVDHIIYVSLKYTRTVDIVRNALKRVIAVCDNLIQALLLHKEVENIPSSPRRKVNKLREIYADNEKMMFYFSIYIFLRDVMNSKYDRKEEFRRGVCMITHLDNRTAFMNIDNLEDNLDIITKDFVQYVHIEIFGEPEELY